MNGPLDLAEVDLTHFSGINVQASVNCYFAVITNSHRRSAVELRRVGASGGVNRTAILNVSFRLPQTVADSVRTTGREVHVT